MNVHWPHKMLLSITAQLGPPLCYDFLWQMITLHSNVLKVTVPCPFPLCSLSYHFHFLSSSFKISLSLFCLPFSMEKGRHHFFLFDHCSWHSHLPSLTSPLFPALMPSICFINHTFHPFFPSSNALFHQSLLSTPVHHLSPLPSDG